MRKRKQHVGACRFILHMKHHVVLLLLLACRNAEGFATPSGIASQRLHYSSVKPCCPVRPLAMACHDNQECSSADDAAGHSTRRQALSALGAATAASFANPAMAAEAEAEMTDGRWWVFPLAPYKRKKTVRTEAVPGQVWTFDQIIGALYVHVPIRMTVVKLSTGGLLAFCPVNPTPECLSLVRELEREHGALKFIVLGSAAIEHKVAAGPFARAFQSAQLWVVPDQYSFPFDWDNVGRNAEGLGRLELTQLFFGLQVRALPRSSDQGDVPWSDDLDHLVLGPLKSRGGQAPGLFEDVAMIHKRSKTLLVTDIIQTAPSEIPEIVLQDPRALLFHARDNAFDKVEDTPEVRQRGWERIALFSLFFQPGGLNIIPWGQAFKDLKGGQMNELGWGGLFPFEWRTEGDNPQGKTFWKKSFEALKDRAFVPAILQKLILDREPDRVLAFADTVASWDFERIVPAHLGAPIAARPADFRLAFSFLDEGAPSDFPGNLEALPLSGDAQFLEDISASLIKLGSVGEPDARVEKMRSQRRAAAGIASLQTAGTEADGWGPFRNR